MAYAASWLACSAFIRLSLSCAGKAGKGHGGTDCECVGKARSMADAASWLACSAFIRLSLSCGVKGIGVGRLVRKGKNGSVL